MKFQNIQTGIITDQINETKEFYQTWLGLEVKFETDWFVLLCLPNRKEIEVAIMAPNQPQVRKPYFQKPYQKSGIWFIFETKDIQNLYLDMKRKNAPIDLELIEEEWGDVHFTLIDPNGIGIDIVQERNLS
ncbi:VOC family protein [Leptospira jelokensis]|uniref:VOC family protein n=1 Tax=Leptospira jelokensis TaxID=2484931 RepID=UPI001090C8B4|nr:VOC family protein [Leptospira jelokensis]TGM05207.1 lactoylglutathione lyase [Leptospira jelokensis]